MTIINILDKITTLRLERGWSEYQLAAKSELTQSTISSWYRKNMLPSIPSLQRICDAFDITLSEFFIEDDDETTTVTVTKKHKLLLEYATHLEPEQLDSLLTFLSTL